MRLIGLMLVGGLALAACTQPELDAAPQAPLPVGAPISDEPGPPTAIDDACGAQARQNWVGRPRSSLPSPPQGADWRIFETGDVLIQDLRPDRLNVEVDPATQAVIRVSCF